MLFRSRDISCQEILFRAYTVADYLFEVCPVGRVVGPMWTINVELTREVIYSAFIPIARLFLASLVPILWIIGC